MDSGHLYMIYKIEYELIHLLPTSLMIMLFVDSFKTGMDSLDLSNDITKHFSNQIFITFNFDAKMVYS